MLNLSESFWSKVAIVEDGCWMWMAGRHRSGYGVFNIKGRQHVAHRLAYEALQGDIPEGLDLDHLCRVRACVNPDHLEPVTRRENLLRSPITLTSIKASQTTCIRGHEFTPENVQIRRKDGTRHCRTCRRERDRRSYIPAAPKTHCSRGHAFTPENTMVRSNGSRNCRTCRRERKRQLRAERREAVA